MCYDKIYVLTEGEGNRMKSILSKDELRSKMKSLLRDLTPQEYRDLNHSLYTYFLRLKFLNKANYIMIYYSVRNEANTVQIINHLLKAGKTVALPVCTPERDLNAVVINDLSQLQPATFGLMEPSPGSPLIADDQLQLIVIPGVAFDEKGRRLGHGAGYYDRFLSKTPDAFKLGLAYDFQLVPEVPAESHDIKMNGLLTPTRYLEF